MEINKTINGDVVVLLLQGRLDANSAPKLETELITLLNECRHVTLDLNELEYTSSAGLRVLLNGHKTAEEKSVSLTVMNILPEVMDILDMTGFTEILNIV